MTSSPPETSPSREEIARGVQQLRRGLSKGGWTPITPRQFTGLQDPGIKGAAWVSRVTYDRPSEDDMARVLQKAICELSGDTEVFTMPRIASIEAQWIGWRENTASDTPGSSYTEQENFSRLCEGAKSDKVIFYCYGGTFM
ncbi:hypothetical protein EV356DRAFT_533261 [Viridothelium virens]|uniref:Uncharacterized protein n=1 Tax=Viridothelium virens TaxID=1048519 RepID=A0A6A6H7W0_VIRVR|nr:hypothetical protein EV356DRAFT_533261 [Viridothelium virens]